MRSEPGGPRSRPWPCAVCLALSRCCIKAVLQTFSRFSACAHALTPFHPSQLYLQSVLGPGEVIFSIIVAYFNTTTRHKQTQTS